jgi:hypothetical protein
MYHLLEGLDLHLRRLGKPSHYNRYRPFYITLAGIGIYKSRGFLFNASSRATVCRDIKGVLEQFFHEWIRDPLQQLFAEFFRRLGVNDKLVDNVQLRELRAEEAALVRMLRNFAEILQTDPTFSTASMTQWFSGSKGLTLADDLAKEFHYDSDDLAERYFEKSLNNPVANVMNGHLMESCMVQSQRMKVLLYASLYSIDSVLMQLKWDFLMAGIMPFLSMCGFFYWTVSNIRRSHFLSRRRMMVRALAEVDRYYNHHSQSLGRISAGNAPLSFENLLGGVMRGPKLRELLREPSAGLRRTPSAQNSLFGTLKSPQTVSPGRFTPQAVPDEEATALELEKVGAALSHLDALCRIAVLMRLEDVDWRNFRKDILDLASPELSVAQKLHIISMIRSSYDIIFSGSVL